jgi:RimJ/RimL family protein N-acetyltransferase
MTKTIPPTRNQTWGFWGTCGRAGWDQQMAWEAASAALATAFDLSPEQVRDLLDARFGRHLADDLSFIPGGPVRPEAIEKHIMMRLADRQWRRWFERAFREICRA